MVKTAQVKMATGQNGDTETVTVSDRNGHSQNGDKPKQHPQF